VATQRVQVQVTRAELRVGAQSTVKINLGAASASSSGLTQDEADGLYQPLDGDLTAISALSTTGFAKRTDTDTWVLVTPNPAAVGAQPLDGDLTAIAALTGTGFAKRTGDEVWALITPNPTDVGAQPLDGDLTALAALASTGLVVRTASDAYTTRTLTAPAAGITVSNGDGVAGNPTLVLADDLAAVEGLGTTGWVQRTGPNAWSTGTPTYTEVGADPAGTALALTIAIRQHDFA
jgi:hypothetical protein